MRLALHPARTGHHHTQDPKFSYKIPAANSSSSKFGEPFTHESISSSTNIYFHTHERFLVSTTVVRSFTNTSRLHYAASAFPPSVAKLLSRYFLHVTDLHLKQYPETLSHEERLEEVSPATHTLSGGGLVSRVDLFAVFLASSTHQSILRRRRRQQQQQSHTHRHVNALLTPTVIHLMGNSKAFQLIFTLTKQLLM